MSSILGRSEKGAVEAALENELVLRHLFSYLPLKELKNCRLVNKFWHFEVGCYIRDFRQCNVNISDDHPCVDLNALEELFSEMTFVPIINSLTLVLFDSFHSNCQFKNDKSKVYAELMKKLPLKYLDISEDSDLRPKQCPAVNFVFTLLHEKFTELHTLGLDFIPRIYQRGYFGKNWTPLLPKLRVLNVGGRWYRQEKLFVKIINGAPNLQKLKGDFDSQIVHILAKEKYALIDKFFLCINSDNSYKESLKLVKTGPALSTLKFGAPKEAGRQCMGKFLSLLEQLLTSSRNTLEEFIMCRENFPLSYVTSPPLTNLKTMTIQTKCNAEELARNVLRPIDYPKMLPALLQVELVTSPEAGEYFLPTPSPWISNCPPSADVHPSKTVQNLEVYGNLLAIKDLSQIFPNVSTLKMTMVGAAVASDPILYGDLWACWPQLETIKLTENAYAMSRTLDADFLGISPEEVCFLKEQDDEFLENMRIVPIRPSILTMPRLKSLTIVFPDLEEQAVLPPDPDQVFLSRLTGILALKRITGRGIKVKFIGKSPDTASRLSHLLPFASVGFRD